MSYTENNDNILNEEIIETKPIKNNINLDILTIILMIIINTLHLLNVIYAVVVW